MFKAKKAQDLRIKIQVEIAKLNSYINNKRNFLGNQMVFLQKKYFIRAPDLTFPFENIVNAYICIEKATKTLNCLHVIFQNSDLIFDKKELPDETFNALEYSYYFSKINKHRDLYDLLSDLTRTRKFKKYPYATHETKVLFGTDQVTMEDAEKYYPEIKRECILQEDEYLANALSKYKSIFQNSLQQNIQEKQTFLQISPISSFQQNQIDFSQQDQIIMQNPVQCMQPNMMQFQQFSQPNLLQNQQGYLSDTPQPPQFTPQFIPQNVDMMQQYGVQNYQQQNYQQPIFIPQSQANDQINQQVQYPSFPPIDSNEQPTEPPTEQSTEQSHEELTSTENYLKNPLYVASDDDDNEDEDEDED